MGLRISQAVADPDWQRLRQSLVGVPVDWKLHKLRQYYEGNKHQVTHAYDPECDVCIQLSNYIRALARIGQLRKKLKFTEVLEVDWQLNLLTETE